LVPPKSRLPVHEPTTMTCPVGSSATPWTSTFPGGFAVVSMNCLVHETIVVAESFVTHTENPAFPAIAVIVAPGVGSTATARATPLVIPPDPRVHATAPFVVPNL